MALDARKERGEYKDADGDFVRATQCVTVTASGSVCVVTAGAKSLGPYGSPGAGMDKWLREKLKAWDALPEEDRAVTLPAAGEADARRAALALPPGALVVRVFNRQLGETEDGTPRYAAAGDYGPKASAAEVDRYAMAQNDFMWIPEPEWRSLVPSEPKAGDSRPVPVAFALRLYRYHLDPARGFTEGANFSRSTSDSGCLTLTVESLNDETMTLKLEGRADLRQSGRDEPGTYAPALLGRLDYDRRRKTFTRFDVVALGKASGVPTDANGKVIIRSGAYPVGIAMELVTDPTPAERLHPRGARDNPAAYLEPQDKKR